jgi:hypothetical protein
MEDELRVALKGKGAIGCRADQQQGQIVDSTASERITDEVGSSWFATGCESYASLKTGWEAPNSFLR